MKTSPDTFALPSGSMDHHGLTIREHFALEAYKSLMRQGFRGDDATHYAVIHADALIEQLNKGKV